MPITKSAKKALRQSKRRQIRNLKRKEDFRAVLKSIQTLLAEEKAKEAEALVPNAYKALDKAAKTGAIKLNNAARKKSRLMAAIRRAKE